MKNRAIHICKTETTHVLSLCPLWLSVLLFSLFNCGCNTAVTEEKKTESQAKAPPAQVRVANVRQESISPRILAVGNVRARRVSMVASASDGIVESMGEPVAGLPQGAGIDEGDFVKAGSVLSQLRTNSAELEVRENRALLQEKEATLAEATNPRKEEVDEALAKFQATDAVLQMAQRRAAELQKLLKNSAVGESEVQNSIDQLSEAQQNHAAAKAAYERIKAGASEERRTQIAAIRDAQQAHVEFLEEEKRKKTTNAPFDGVIVQTHAEVGQWLAKGSPVATIADLSSVEVEVQVDQTLIDQVSPGTAVQIRIPGAEPLETGAGGQKSTGRWSGSVATIVPKSDWQNGSRSFPVIVRIDNEMIDTNEGKQYRLKEGMMAEVEFEGSPIDAVLVPKDALVRSAEDLFVFAVNPAVEGAPLSVRKIVVTTGISKDGWIEVQGTDLTAANQVVSQGGERLRPFADIVILPDDTPSGKP